MCRYAYNLNYCCVNIPIINRLTDRQALYLTTITTAAGTVLPPKQTFAVLPAAN